MSVTVVDSFELIAREYVIVSNPPLDMSSDSITVNHLETKIMSPLLGENGIKLISNIPVTIITATTKDSCNSCLENHSCAPSGTSLGSLVIKGPTEQPSTDSTTRIKSLKNCASTITQLVNEKVKYCNPLCSRELNVKAHLKVETFKF